jgi:hypothetical protein
MLRWLRRCQEARRLAQADGRGAHIRDNGAEAYREARQRERDVVCPTGRRMPAGRRRTGGSHFVWRRDAVAFA